MLARTVQVILPRVREGRFFAAGEWATLVCVADVLLETAPIEVAPEDVATNVELFLLRGRSRRAWRVRALLTLIEASTYATHGRPFRRLTKREQREVVTDQWMSGKHLWRLCAKVRNLVILGAYGDRRAAAQIGFVPVPLRLRFQQRPMATSADAA